MPAKSGQLARLLAHLRMNHMARARELGDLGIAATTISRAVAAGLVQRDRRGLYRTLNAPIDIHDTLSVLSRRVPHAIICLTSALCFHEVTDRMPDRIWIGIGSRNWAPKIDYPRTKVVRYREDRLLDGAETHRTATSEVRVHSVAKAIADILRPRARVEHTVAIDSMWKALNERKTTPDELARVARANGVWKRMEPYLETIVTGGYSGYTGRCLECGSSSD